jgi:UDP-3-O-acyl N-acetylglucosamine deacetylase
MTHSPQRRQQTLARSVTVSGFGLFQGCDVTAELCPADPGHGIVFQRVDLPGDPRIPALVEYVAPQNRCTLLTCEGASVAVVEHLLAALAGLQVDNCLVRLSAPEPPAGDGSALLFVEAVQSAGIVPQDALRETIAVEETVVHVESERVGIAAQPARAREYQIGFVLDYGPGPISQQSVNLTITPESFLAELANCRTFVLKSEVDQLRAQGLAQRATTQNALVFGPEGVIDNTLRRADECVRHKVLDCVGDFALIGCDLVGRFTATRSGHRLNHAIIRQIRAAMHRRSSSSSRPCDSAGVGRSHRLPAASPPPSSITSPLSAAVGLKAS